MKATRHCGRNSSFSVKHNDRNFDYENADHIDAEAEKGNVYWDCIRCFVSLEKSKEPEDTLTSFGEVELVAYEALFSDYVSVQNGRYEAARQYNRSQSIEKLHSAKRTTPEETILQIGNIDLAVDRDTLLQITEEYMQRFEELFGSHYGNACESVSCVEFAMRSIKFLCKFVRIRRRLK